MTPAFASSALKVVAIETESKTASTATWVLSSPARVSCSASGMLSRRRCATARVDLVERLWRGPVFGAAK